MEAGNRAGVAEGSVGDQDCPGCPGGSRSPSTGPASRSGTGWEGAAARGAPQVEGTLEVSGRDGATGTYPEQLLEFTLTVPFLCFLEAKVARRSLLTAPFRGPDHRGLRVDGSDLIVHLTADDPGALQSSITSFLNDLAEVVRTMQRIVPPFPNDPLLGKDA
ncbi:EKC/KEOPS complex subunit LAGE3-like [Dasypus novemcinctus]|uniref:EKC/KEOPS complex subunit LAGE3-like n=1 Tax=Dasypus novemcinctus TaxID=9361 RepID=UPI000328E9F3|nr:EKC/KEOPS complex subunit LAGE3-like [Dasypus novemcinctus]